mmetsp:Transcript_23503/g.73932  ORF Transcript_23503/g.73932 Transcript_23503/m.73932 type:complete len:306 (+) Transcript_23503:468-1385(+)
MTACVMVRVSYRSQSVSNFHSSRSTATKNCLIPSSVSSSRLTRIRTCGRREGRACRGRVAGVFHGHGEEGPAHGVGHELARHLEDLVGQRRRDEDDLGGGRQVAVDVVDLLLEALGEHLIRLVDDEHLDCARAQVAAADHVEDAARRAGDGVHSGVEAADVLADRLASDAGVALHRHVVSEREHHLLRLLCQLARRGERERLGLALRGVDAVQHAHRKDGRLAGARLRLRDGVAALEDGHDGALLDGGRLLKAVRVDAAEQLVLEPHGIEGLDDLHVVRRAEVERLVVNHRRHGAALLWRGQRGA